MTVTEPDKPKSEEPKVPSADEGSLLSVLVWPAQRAGWAVERRVIWPASDALRRFADVATWPFERIIWAFRSRVAWPVQDELATRGRPIRTAVAVSAVGVVVAAASAGALTGAPGGGEQSKPEPGPAPTVAAVAPIDIPGGSRIPINANELGQPAIPPAPKLRGVTPSFKAAGPKDAGDKAPSDPSPSSDPAAPTAPPADPVEPVDTPPATPGQTGATAKVPAPATIKPALDVSKQFADAFVLYEVGKRDAKVTKTFTKTAAKPLVQALRKRPPRLPRGVKVPKAKVLNVVPGPRHGRALSVSVALLRLGASSELRLELRHDQKAGWLVSDVRG